VFDPTASALVPQPESLNKLLMRRYYLVERAKDASIFGIVVGTLGVGTPQPLYQHVVA
jgi:diphthamide biosynthesis protein 2